MRFVPQTSMRSIVSLFLLTAFCAVGCGIDAESRPPSAAGVTVPEEFTLEGHVWKKESSLTDADRTALVRFFNEHPSLAEGPLVEGEPVVYSASRSHRRFYWIESVPGDEPQWLMIEIRNRRISHEQGTGPPFPL